MKVQLLTEKNKKQISVLDKISGDEIALFFEDFDNCGYDNLSLYGLFENDILIGYCFLADIFPCQEFCDYTYFNERNSLILGSVFVHPDYRNKGCGLFMIENAIKMKTSKKEKDVYLVLSNLELEKFYNKLGFKMFTEGFMVKHA